MPLKTADEITERITLERETKTGRLNLSGGTLDRELKFTEIPDDVFTFDHLTELDISWQKLAVIPDTISRLPNLQSLRIAGNDSATLPDCLSLLPQLRELSIGYNEFNNVPECVFSL